MRAAEPRAKDKKNEDRPESTGKAYERLVDDLFMGDSSEEEEPSEDDDTE